MVDIQYYNHSREMSVDISRIFVYHDDILIIQQLLRLQVKKK